MKLLISLPLSNDAQKYYGSDAAVHNKTGDAGVDLPFVRDMRPYDAEEAQTLMRIDFETIFAMYSLPNVHNFKLGDTFADYTAKMGLTRNFYGDLRTCVTQGKALSFIVCPRSSIDKTSFRQANSIGIIDKTYKGITTDSYGVEIEADTLKASLDYHPQLGKIDNKPYLSAGERILQIVAPALDDILHVRLDYTETNMGFWSEVIGNKSRGGFGSTGV